MSTISCENCRHGIPSLASSFSSASVCESSLRTGVGLSLLLGTDSATISVVSVDDMDMVSPVGPFHFFLGNTAFMSFDAFHFKAFVIFVKVLVDPSDLQEEGIECWFYVTIFVMFCMLCSKLCQLYSLSSSRSWVPGILMLGDLL